MPVARSDRSIIRDLARQIAEAGASPAQRERSELWRSLNGLQPTRPLVWISEIPWHEMGEDVRPMASDPGLHGLECEMRQLLYQWRHFPCDMVIDPTWSTPYVFHDTGYGLQAETTAPELTWGAKHFEPVIRDYADIDKIGDPQIAPDWEATERHYQFLCDLFGDILTVQKQGVVHEWFAPWDVLVQWYGIDQLYLDMTDRPRLVHMAVNRFVEAAIHRLDQLEQNGLLSVSNGNHRVGSGGLGITDELPQKDYDPNHVRPLDQWGTSTGQIFSGASPAMHEEFCLRYEIRYLERFGLNCYGCCEPLDRKIPILKQIPRLRRISISPWADAGAAAGQIGTDYVLSLKPNPAVLAFPRWDPSIARRELREFLLKVRGCRVEVIMKDVHTLRGEPRRLSEWAQMAMEEVSR